MIFTNINENKNILQTNKQIMQMLLEYNEPTNLSL